LYVAKTLECVEILIDYGANIHKRTKKRSGFTSLHYQVMNDCPENVQFLIDHGANVNAKNEFGETPLHFVSSPRVAQILINNDANVNAKTTNCDWAGQTPLHTVVTQCPVSSERQKKIKHTIKVLFDNGAFEGIDIQDEQGRTPLHVASYQNIKILINHGANVNICSDKYGTPLHIAIKSELYLKAEMLIECGAHKYAICKHKDSKIGAITPRRLAKIQRKNAEGYMDAQKIRELFRTKKEAKQEKAQ
jgi:hypothetical protein